MPPPTHYEILSLAPSLLTTTPSHNQLLKRAYRRALLNHHPDKTSTTNPNTTTTSTRSAPPAPKTSYTIDQITLAYTTLSAPSLRAAYDRSLVLTNTNPFFSSSSSLTNPHNNPSPSSSSQQDDRGNQKTGLETVDLDDLDYDESGEWFRACRCGNARGFRVGEEDLDEALGEAPPGSGSGGMGEVVVGCVDCSLWLRVLFAVAEGQEGDEGEGGGGRVEGAEERG